MLFARVVLQLASLSGRTPIIPPFYPYDTQLGYPEGSDPHPQIPLLNFSDMFDVPYLLDKLSKPDPISSRPTINGIVEWNELMDIESGPYMSNQDRLPIGCWQTLQTEDNVNSVGHVLKRTGLSTSTALIPYPVHLTSR